jgi:hypothetical protein
MGFNYFVGFNNILCYFVDFESRADLHLYFARYSYYNLFDFDMQNCCLVADSDILDC